jgi:hypothetical protein
MFSARLREKRCTGKRRFTNETDARAAARDSAVVYQEPYEAWGTYECQFCKGHHIGHNRGWKAVAGE